jgi:hypothetical protein
MKRLLRAILSDVSPVLVYPPVDEQLVHFRCRTRLAADRSGKVTHSRPAAPIGPRQH